MKSENGYTLITTLLIATLIVAVSFTLIGMSLNTNKQIQLSEQELQATNLAEMGLIYFQEKVNETTTNYTNTSDVVRKINELQNKLITIQSVSTKPRQFKITFNPLNGQNLATDVTFYGCVGSCDDPNSKKETISTTIQLSKKNDSGSTVVVSIGNGEMKLNPCNELSTKGKISTSCYFKDQTDLDRYLSNQKKNELTIQGAEIYFLDSVAIQDIKFTSNSNKLCVYGGLTVATNNTGNGNASVYAYNIFANFDRKKINTSQGQNTVTTNCGTYTFSNNNAWIPKLINTKYH